MFDISTPNTSFERSRGQVLHEVARLRRASWAFTTRRVPRGAASRVVQTKHGPDPGDLVLATVGALGHHRGLQLSNGRRKHLFPGEEIVVTYANRYAPSQFEAIVPETLGPCQLVAGGGIAAKALSWHTRISRGPTQITPLGLLSDMKGQVLNLRDFALHAVSNNSTPHPATVAVVGTGMDSGKTQSAAFLVRGLTLAGLQVGFAKVTGTGAGGDTWLLKDAGANPVLDFTDAGYASTYLVSHSEIEAIFQSLVAHLSKSGVDAIVLELADGVFQAETAALLESQVFREIVGGIVFTARDSMGAAHGANWLGMRKLPVMAIGGVLTAAPLQCEEANMATGLQTYRREDLATPKAAMKILSRAHQNRLRRQQQLNETNRHIHTLGERN